ncbi:MAG TPA: EAL domain-containing protein [Oxalicibacterium sp.]|jgi:sensor c-di-GMP phosphodiesterase-like protein|nr:EAL domain-containing protein [Oxalicibacterium sp.]
MNRAVSSALFVVLCALAMAAPIAVSIRLAEWQGHQDEMALQQQLAAGLARRADATNLQIIEAFRKLKSRPDIAPCSPADMDRMRSIALASTHLKGVAYIDGDRVLCSSIGKQGNGFSLGKPDFVTRKGAEVWPAVPLPYAPDTRFFVLKVGHYAVISHQEMTIDVLSRSEDMHLGIFTLPSGLPLFLRGYVSPDWLRHLDGKTQVSFMDDGYLVAVQRSEQFDLASVSAIPVAYAQSHIAKFLMLFVPAGIGMGLALTGILLLLMRRRMSLNSEMQAALRRNEFHLVYQPVIDLRSGYCVGAEALLRWRRRGRPIGPDVFIPVAEQSGLIRRLTARVLDMVGAEVQSLLAQHADFHIGINLSFIDLQAEETMDEVMKMVAGAGIAPANIMIEATERGLLNADTTRNIVRAFRDKGLRVAIDDFGTGYSSLSYLANFDLDYLKIDKSFVDTLGTDAATSNVALHIIEMSKSLKLDMIAEGVETEAQAQILRERGVQYAQGWLFARPMPIADLMRFVDANNRQPVLPFAIQQVMFAATAV